jgi:FtsP/CotA-like multicopper oxidase with cupredoxin domain
MGQAPGTHWYHAHKHGSTANNVANGMTGVFIIEGPYDDALNAFYGADWTRSAKVMNINQLGVTPNLLRGGTNNQQGGITATDKGPDFSVNGQMNPVINMRPGEVQMWRIVNTSGRAGTFFNTPDTANLQWMQIAQDGVQFNWVNADMRRNKSFLLASGNRADLLVKARSCPQNQTTCTYTFPVIVQNEVDPSDLSRALPFKLLTVNVSGDQVPSTLPAGQFIPQASFPARPDYLDDIRDSEVTGTKILTFSSTPPNLPAAPGSANPPMAAQHMINNKKFDGEVGALVQLNKVEEWKIVNQTYGPPIAHPFHIHVNPFQVTEIFDPNAKVTVTGTDPKTKKPISVTVAQYVIAAGALYTNPQNLPFQRQVRAKQCLLNPQAPESWKPCQSQGPNVNNIWWDVFPIPSGNSMSYTDPKTNQTVSANVPGYFKMRSRFVDYAGYYVLHCHILAHEDRGMMTVVEVSPATTPYSHH